jgi:REP element-mobilizing transposase RayT
VWPDRAGNISYLLTLCVDGRTRVLDNEATFQRLTAFLLDSPLRYRWFPRRFVVMPDHVHLIAHQGPEAVRLAQWIKALKAVVGGLERRVDCAEERPVGAPGLQHDVPVGRVPSPGDAPSPGGAASHEFSRIKRFWRWQEGFHDHKFRTPESEQRKWEYVCLNPVRYGLVARPEQWPFGGEIFYDAPDGPRLVRGTPPLLETGLLIEEKPTGSQSPGQMPGEGIPPPGEGTRPTT